MRTLLPPAPGSAPAGPDREQRVRALGRQIAAGQAAAGRGRARALEDRGMELLSRDPALKAALFRLVDVAPACSGPFGGDRLSGTGTKAGGPGYLLQFVEPRGSRRTRCATASWCEWS